MTKTIAINTASKLIGGINQLHVEAGTNGPKGGDSGHGCRTFIRIAEAGGTDWGVTVEGGQEEDGVFDSPSAIEITLGGDSELDTMIRALEFVLAALKGTTEGGTLESREMAL